MPTRRFDARPHIALFAILIAAASSAIPSAAGAQLRSPLSQQLDSLAGAGVSENRAVGLVAAVVKGNDTLLLQAYGKADIEANTSMTVDALFPIGSITKQFTAAAILQLRDQGKLSLDDALTKWLPDFDIRGNTVTLRNLLTHTSGIVGLTEMPELRSLQRDTVATRDSAYRVISHYAFQFPTGTREIYSNSGFFLLGLIIEKASGMTYKEYVEQKLFAPLGMRRSMYCSNSPDIPHRAYGYGMRNGSTRRAPPIVFTWPYAAGALCSTAGDLVTWTKALHGGKVLSPRSYAEMIAPAKLNDGTPLRYGMGLAIAEDNHGVRYIGHDGGINAYSSDIKWYPDTKMAVVVLTNSIPNVDPVSLTGDLAARVVPAPQVRPFAGDASSLVGTYKGLGNAGDMTIEVTQSSQGLAASINGAPTAPLVWVKELTFRRNGSVLVFNRTGNNGPATVLHYDTAGDHFILTRQ